MSTVEQEEPRRVYQGAAKCTPEMQLGLLCLEAAVPLLTHVGLVPPTAAGIGGARALPQPRLTFGGCWVPVTDAGQLTAVC